MTAKRKIAMAAPSSLSFEQAMEELEDIVEAMESEQLPLEQLVSRYEEGSALLKHCASVLSAAKKRIELITLADREETETEDGGAPTGDTEENNDISLF